MNPVARILWEAATDVERRGVTRPPDLGGGETCVVVAVDLAAQTEPDADYFEAIRLVEASLGISDAQASHWNDRQPSRAVVAAAMRDAAQLAEWAGPHLLKPKP